MNPSNKGLEVWTFYWIDVWSSKWIQMVLNAVFQKLEERSLDFEQSQKVLRGILKYPGIWDEWNISKFIDVFHIICKRFAWKYDDKMTLIGTWKIFNDLRCIQDMKGITISVEDDVNNILKSEWTYASAGSRISWRSVRI